MSLNLDNLSLPFAARKQAAILWFLITDRHFFEHSKHRIKPQWFSDLVVGKVYAALLAFYESYGRVPRKEELLGSNGFMVEEPAVRSAMRATVEMAYNESQVYGLDVLRAELTEWLRAYIYKEGTEKSTALFQQQKFSEAYKITAEHIKLIQETRFEEDNVFDFSDLAGGLTESEERVSDGCTFGLKMVDDALSPGGASEGGGLFKRGTTCLMAPVNIGKCVRPDTPIMMSDGTIRKVQDVKSGDKLMGPDGKPRLVLSTTQGRGQMYDIIPKSGGDTWGCNDAHILNLKCVQPRPSVDGLRKAHNRKFYDDRTENISVGDYLKTNREYKYNMRLWRASLDFEHKDLLVDPYILGMWLGDGHSHCAALTSMDQPLVDEWTRWVTSTGDQIRTYSIGEGNKAKAYRASSPRWMHRSACTRILKNLGVLGNKCIPHEYLTSSVGQRLALLAGLVDIDGHYVVKSRTYEIVSKLLPLADQYAFLARSLGFKASVQATQKSCQTGAIGTYYRVFIRGALSRIPVRLPRKKALDSKKDSSVSGFRVVDTGVGDYYGFTLDGDGLFLLGDFTVTHNTSTMISVVCANIERKKRVLLLVHEGDDTDIRDMLLENLLGMDKRGLWSLRTTAHGRQILLMMEQQLKTYLTFLPYIKAQMTVEDVIPQIRRLCDDADSEGRSYDLLADDYPELLLSEHAKAARMEERARIMSVYQIFAQLASELNVHCLVNAQTNRAGSTANRQEDRLLGLEDVAESFGIVQKMTNVITLNRSPGDMLKNRITFHIVKSRSGATGRAVVARSDFTKCITHSDREGFGSVWYYGNKMIASDELDTLMPICHGGEITEQKVRDYELQQSSAKDAAKRETAK